MYPAAFAQAYPDAKLVLFDTQPVFNEVGLTFECRGRRADGSGADNQQPCAVRVHRCQYVSRLMTSHCRSDPLGAQNLPGVRKCARQSARRLARAMPVAVHVIRVGQRISSDVEGARDPWRRREKGQSGLCRLLAEPFPCSLLLFEQSLTSRYSWTQRLTPTLVIDSNLTALPLSTAPFTSPRSIATPSSSPTSAPTAASTGGDQMTTSRNMQSVISVIAGPRATSGASSLAMGTLGGWTALLGVAWMM